MDHSIYEWDGVERRKHERFSSDFEQDIWESNRRVWKLESLLSTANETIRKQAERVKELEEEVEVWKKEVDIREELAYKSGSHDGYVEGVDAQKFD